MHEAPSSSDTNWDLLSKSKHWNWPRSGVVVTDVVTVLVPVVLRVVVRELVSVDVGVVAVQSTKSPELLESMTRFKRRAISGQSNVESILSTPPNVQDTFPTVCRTDIASMAIFSACATAGHCVPLDAASA